MSHVDLTGQRMTLVGAGLVGSLLAIFLARRGASVEVLERRPDMRKHTISAGRSINLAISARGLHALRQVGLEQLALESSIAMRGRRLHAASGELTFQPYSAKETDCIRSISRGWLNRALLDAAEKTGRVRFSFETCLAGVDLAAGTLTFRDERTGALSTRDAGVVIGTDGSGSLLRAAIAESAGTRPTEEVLSHGYKELTITREDAAGLELGALHIWPRGAHMLIALPNVDGSFTCTLFLAFRGENSFERLAAPADVDRFFSEQYPDARARMPRLVEEFFANPTGQMITVKTTPWAAGTALVMGDAAHAIVPFFGQGMNCGFEDCTRLDALLETEGTIEAAFAALSRERKPNADAIADMAVENFIEMRDKVADPRFLLEKEVERLLQRTFPETFVSRYSYVSFSREPYRFAYEMGQVQAGILAELCGDLSRADEVDLARARALIEERLAPRLTAR